MSACPAVTASKLSNAPTSSPECLTSTVSMPSEMALIFADLGVDLEVLGAAGDVGAVRTVLGDVVGLVVAGEVAGGQLDRADGAVHGGVPYLGRGDVFDAVLGHVDY